MAKHTVIRNYGGTYQLRIETAEDLKSILGLDDARWVASSAPIDGLNCDPVFLKLVDNDNNGRIRTDEIRTAISWMFEMLSDTSGLTDKSEVLPLDAINISHQSGQKLRAGAERVLRNVGRGDAAEIRLSDIRDRQKILADAAANGDGVIPPEGCSDAELAEFVKDIIDSVGGSQDASGDTGVDLNRLNQFLGDASSYLGWRAAGKVPEGKKDTDIMVWGDTTADAYSALAAVRGKVDDYFSLCTLVRFEPNLKGVVGLTEAEIQKLNDADLGSMEEEIKKAPLASVSQKVVLDLSGTINPYYADAVAAFYEKVVASAFGKGKQLDMDGWLGIKAVFEPYRSWVESKKGEAVENLGEEKLRRYLDGDFADRVKKLIEADASVAGEVAEVAKIEKLILCRRWLIELVNNVVSMPRLYDPGSRCMFQVGSLTMDGRQFDFNIRVPERAKHKKTAQSSNVFLMYVEVTGKDTNDKFEVATPVTAGSIGNLVEGKQGVFFTMDGKEWDARVVEVIRNPVSLWESVKAPFVSLASTIERQVEKITSARYADLDTKLQKGMQTPAKPAAQPAGASGSWGNMLFGGSIAVAGLGAAFAFITEKLSKVKIGPILIVLAVALGALMIPIIVLGIVRLRRRDIAAILEASGWAVNARLRITGSLGRLLTFVPAFPEDATKERTDLVKRFARRAGRQGGRAGSVLLCILLAAVCALLGYFVSDWLGLVLAPGRMLL